MIKALLVSYQIVPPPIKHSKEETAAAKKDQKKTIFNGRSITFDSNLYCFMRLVFPTILSGLQGYVLSFVVEHGENRLNIIHDEKRGSIRLFNRQEENYASLQISIDPHSRIRKLPSVLTHFSSSQKLVRGIHFLCLFLKFF